MIYVKYTYTGNQAFWYWSREYHLMQKCTLVTTIKKHCWFSDLFLNGKVAYAFILRVCVCNLALTIFQKSLLILTKLVIWNHLITILTSSISHLWEFQNGGHITFVTWKNIRTIQGRMFTKMDTQIFILSIKWQ